MAASCGLDSHHKKYLVQQLRPGLLCGSLAQGNWRHPFLFTTPLLKSSTRRYEGDGAKALDSLPVIPAPEFLDWMPPWMRKEMVPPVAPAELPSSPATDVDTPLAPPKSELAEDALRLLKAIVADPCQPVSFYPAKAQLSKRKALQLRRMLVSKKLIQEQSVQLSKRGRPSILLDVTDKGKTVLKQAEGGT